MTRLLDCNQCHNRVLPNASDARCPACGGDPLNTEGANPDLHQVRIHCGHALPNTCITCGAPTERTVPVDLSRTLNAESTWSWLLVGLVSILQMSPRLANASQQMRGIHQPLRLDLPLCAGCPCPEPEFVDHARQQVVYLVHRRFQLTEA